MRPTATDKHREREEIARHTAEFLARGGQITNCDIERRDASPGSWKERSDAGKRIDPYASVNQKRKINV